MKKHSKAMNLDAMGFAPTTRALAEKCSQVAVIHTPLHDGIVGALSIPFPVSDDPSKPLAAISDLRGEWTWAVFSNRAPGNTELGTMRSLCKKLRAGGSSTKYPPSKDSF
ncbi:hypothetical protein E2553_18915 [Paraburkholderia dipogonis]|uniref:Uncharacterized protein n=1 Tax=Paraburkholderia dipogonis TaxID=1211383 RepID=A0A4Y8NAV9_9BURK|nr:hypothetical protein [Paraburkholderia dipogonis]TFE46927.1 hypothetical protein E2553_18915 [Paraburkholderia dipogonis]